MEMVVVRKRRATAVKSACLERNVRTCTDAVGATHVLAIDRWQNRRRGGG